MRLVLSVVLLALLPTVALAQDPDTGEPCPSGLDEVGRCEGRNVLWCEGDTLHRIECDLFQVCAFSDADGYYDCADDVSGAGTCVGHCGEKTPGGCWCDSKCASNGDCCTDICEACGFCGGAGGSDAGSGGTGGADAGSGGTGGADAGSGGTGGSDAGSGGSTDAGSPGSGSNIGNPYGTSGPSAYPSKGSSGTSGCGAAGGAPGAAMGLLGLVLVFGLRRVRRGVRG